MSVPIKKLEEVKENDIDETVRDRAEWAISTSELRICVSTFG